MTPRDRRAFWMGQERRTVTPRDRRALMLGAIAILAAVLLLRMVPWGMRRVIITEQNLRQRATLLGQTRLHLEGVGAMEDSIALLTRALATLAPKLLSGSTAAEAGADLAGRLNLIASRHHIKIERQDQRPDSVTAGWLRRLVVRIAVESDIRGIASLLRALAGGDAALLVEQIRIIAPDPGALNTGPEVLKGEFTITGWYLAGQVAKGEERMAHP